ncbi:MAG: hypothetical protein IME99_01335 [Proteobacteria bacterium]|nr:hypothetical protein [Pseudomonadota bacterium]
MKKTERSRSVRRDEPSSTVKKYAQASTKRTAGGSSLDIFIQLWAVVYLRIKEDPLPYNLA